MSRALVAFHWDCGRMGDLDGLFVATEKEMKDVMGKNVYFGEVLGKHSEIFGVIEEENFEIKSDDQNFIDKLVSIIGSTNISGYNPIDYYEPTEDEDE